MSLAAKVLSSLILIYKRTVSPTLLSSCRFTPACSDYALEAVERHGAFMGGVLALRRVLRCHPLTQGGLDLVPLSLHNSENRTHQVSAKQP